MGAGWTWIAPGEPAGKDGGRSMLKNIVIDWLSPRYWWSSSSTVFRWVTPRLAMSKTGRTVSSPASPGAVGTTSLLSGTLVFSSLFWASSRRVPIMSSRSFAREGRAGKDREYFLERNALSWREGGPALLTSTATASQAHLAWAFLGEHLLVVFPVLGEECHSV